MILHCGRELMTGCCPRCKTLNGVQYLPYCHLNPIQLTSLVHYGLLVINKAHWFKPLQFITNVLDESANLIIDDLCIAFILDLVSGFLHFSIDILADFF